MRSDSLSDLKTQRKTRRTPPEPSFSLDDLMTVEQVSEALHVSVKTVRDWIYKKLIWSTKFRGRVYCSRRRIEAVLQANGMEPLFDNGTGHNLGREVGGSGGKEMP